MLSLPYLRAPQDSIWGWSAGGMGLYTLRGVGPLEIEFWSVVFLLAGVE